jgi:hypothetical protein
MEFHIQRMHSTVEAVDSSALLSKQVMNQVVRQCLDQLREELDRERQLDEERQLRPKASAEQTTHWE